MSDIKRRDFLKKCGIGAGAVMTSNLWLSPVLSGCAEQQPEQMSENYFGFTKEDLQKLLLAGLSKGAEFSELYFEHRKLNSVTMAEDIIKSSSESISLGVGVRVIKGETIGYGFTNELTFEKIKQAILTAATIASGTAKEKIANLNLIKPAIQVYDLKNPINELELKSKIESIKTAYEAAQSYDSKITKVSASMVDEIQHITIANSEGLLVSDIRPQARLTVSANAELNGRRSSGYHNGGGRIGMNFYEKVKTPKEIGERAAHEALELLKAENADPGEQMVVLSKDQSGVMIHEAVGHPLEADANWKKTSIMWDKMGQQVATPLVTIHDDATIRDYRGSLNIDDEGTQVGDVPLIEKGKLVGFLNDKLSANIMGKKLNGHGRRQSYKHPPIPRMNNTILDQGDSSPEDIIKSVKKGFYAVTYQGGMVNNTGEFTFSVNLGYKIEDGKLTKPLKNATLIGKNIEILNNIDMVGNDMGFFLGTCGKEGQSVPVTAGTPTLRISKMTVGGTKA